MSAIPKLRFPEFDGEWYPIEFGDLASLQSGYAFSSEYFGSVGRKLVTPKNFKKNGFGDFSPEVTKYTSENVDEKFICSSGDILILMTDLTPSCELLGKPLELTPADGNVLLNQRIVRVDSCEEKISKGFLKAIILGDPFHKRVVETASGSTVRHSSNRIINEITITIPPLPEQQKIASFLSSVDKKIDLLRQKKDALDLYKKGLMQKIFSQEIRFKQDNGSDFPDWEELALGDVASITTGTGNREDSQETGQYIFFDRSTDIRWSDKYEFDQEAIIVAGEGKSFPPRYYAGKFGLHQRAYAIYDFKNASARFLFYMVYLRSNFFLKMSVGSTMPSLRMNAFTEFPIDLPCPAEQQKIADCLSAIDAKIQNTSSQIEQMETFKKGLLQQMFV